MKYKEKNKVVERLSGALEFNKVTLKQNKIAPRKELILNV